MHSKEKAMKLGMRLWAVSLVLAILVSGSSVRAQDKTDKTDKTHKHNSVDPLKCRVCSSAYNKALALVLKKLSGARAGRSANKILTGWLLLADGRHSAELKALVKEAITWKYPNGSQSNWYRALTALFLVEYAKFFPDQKVKRKLRELVIEFQELQWPKGGWSYKPLPGNKIAGTGSVHGMMSSIIYSFLLSAKTLGVEVPDKMLSRADASLMKCFKKGIGIGYKVSLPKGEKTGARGGILMHGLSYAGKTDHPIYRDHLTLLPKLIPDLEQAHHAGYLQGLGVVLGCFNIGPSAYKKLTDRWLDRLMARRNSDGSVCIDSDQSRFDPGVKRRETFPSTAVFALMILLQDPTRLQPGG